MKPTPVGSYDDADGEPHELVVRATAHGDWQVLDVEAGGERARVIDTLDGREDGRPQAEAIARDYLTTVEPTGASARRDTAEPIPEEGGPDADSDRRPRREPRTARARGLALPRAAR